MANESRIKSFKQGLLLGFLCVVFFGMPSSCKQDEAKSADALSKQEQGKPFMIHTVYFWFKDEVPQERKVAFEKDLAELGKVPSIQSYYYGPPAPTENRDVVDSSYDMAINVHFASVEDEAAYQIDPIHLKFVEECKDLWDKVVVYDNIVR